MKKITFLFILFLQLFFITSCKKEIKKLDLSIKIKLEKEIGNPDIFDMNYTDFHFTSYYKKHPEFYENLHNSIKGIPVLDTSFIASRYANNWRFSYYLNKDGFLSDSIYNRSFGNLNKDSLGFDTELDNEFTLFTGLKNGRQLVIVDTNKNYDFSDDKIIEFSKNFDSNQTKYDTIFSKIPLTDYTYELYHEGEVIKYKRKAIIYPAQNHPYTDFFNEDSLNKRLHIMGKLKDHWKGEIKVDNQKYTVLCQGFSKEYLQILIKPDSIEFHKNDYIKNKKFEYSINDTISLADNVFVLDSFALSASKLILKKIVGRHKFGFRTGETLNDLLLEDLNQEKFRISNVINNKKYTLIDFWGTWCPPCLETTPLLKDIDNRFSENLEIIGIAYDNRPEKVLDYTKKNKMNWTQAFIKSGYDLKSPVQKLRIDYFPTFLLLDKDSRIIIRGIGMDGLKEIDDYLSKIQFK